MKSPRIYTYKVTFEEVPYWYWGVHKEKKFGESYLGSPITHRWMWEFYTPKIQILEVFPHTGEGWRKAQGVEKRIIRPDLNNPLCLNEHAGGGFSLESCSRGGKEGMKKTHEEKDENGKSKHATKTGSKAGKKAHEEKDEDGKSLHALRQNKKLHEERDNNGKSLHSLKMNRKLHEEKDEKGKSLHSLGLHKEKDELGRSLVVMKTNSQVWQSEIDGFRSTSAGVALHNKARGWNPNARVRVS